MLKNNLKASIRAYDIRGIGITSEQAILLASALSQYCKFKRVVIGRDNRMNSLELAHGLTSGFNRVGVIVKDIGLVTTPNLYHHALLEAGTLGIMITASHNPPEYNGFKIILDGKVVERDTIIQAIDEYVDVESENSYLGYLLEMTKLNRCTNSSNVKILWDCNNGATAKIVNQITNTLPNINHIINTAEYITKQPDPTININVERVKKMVKEHDVAICFDGDGDRIIIVAKNGIVLRGDKILLFLARHLKSLSGSNVVVDVKTSSFVTKELEKIGLKVTVEKTGHAFIKNRMSLTNAQIGGEVSGHIFFTFNNYPYDDAILAACYIAKLLIDSPECINNFISLLPQTSAIHDLKIHCPRDKQELVIQHIIDDLKLRNKKFSLLDGVKYESEDGWWLVRLSNTETALVMCVESQSSDQYTTYIEYIKNALHLFAIDMSSLP